jgi:hypothetical protein
VLVNDDSVGLLASILSKMKSSEQRKYIDAVIASIIKSHFSAGVINREDEPLPVSKTVSGAAALVHTLIKESEALKEHLVSLLTRSTIPTLDDSVAARRSVLSALAQDDGLYLVSSMGTMLTCGRKITHTARELYQVVWRLRLHQAHTCATTRRYDASMVSEI